MTGPFDRLLGRCWHPRQRRYKSDEPRSGGRRNRNSLARRTASFLKAEQIAVEFARSAKIIDGKYEFNVKGSIFAVDQFVQIFQFY
jgi:hypothetical protein